MSTRKGPFDELVTQAAELLDQIDKGVAANKYAEPEGITESLELLEKAMLVFKEAVEASLEEEAPIDEANLTQRQKHLREQLERLKHEFHARQVMMEKALILKQGQAPVEEDDERKKKLQMKKKFKRMGGDQNWIPM